ncbi:class II aldolase/adducin family protein, partial [Sinorhizobium sp. BJ1]|uniref:class II aldolase/adducin family protein n=1 Tax=Sinorhizobium sp. BJ1 TaxID=2035455 RepID=UPI000BEB7582
MAALSEETRTRDDIVRAGKSIFDRGLTFGSTGDISVKMSDGRMLMTPTNASLGSLVPERLSLFSAEGVHLGGDKPTKEAFLHRCMYCARQHGKAVVHLHSTYSVAVSILKDVD